ncbi:BTAD domain-containing putative transcriptional regulator [Paractinoplanes atraurantiacus]|nr:BTAD domain-containing putative transcriptional regulator [Actinoplanes atraurantiacus]
MESGSLRLRILGPLRLWRDGAELGAGPRQQAYLLALLLAKAGRPISVTELIDLIWGEDSPASAVNVLHKYVGGLRHVLEPGLRARETGTYLLRRGNGYLFVPDPEMVDLVAFRNLVETAGAERDDTALDNYVAALSLWHGPAGDGLAHTPAAMPIFAGLNGEFFDACVAAAGLAVSRGRPERVVPALRLAASMGPLHEPVQASLISVLGAAGQQAEALALYRTVRERLAHDLGIDPGPALEQAHRQVLGRPQATAAPAPVAVTPAPPGLIGRDDELARLWEAVNPALSGGSGLALVDGEPGAGKTRLLEEIAAEARRRGVTVVWGACVEGAGAPSLWPWMRALRALVADLPVETRDEWLVGDVGRLVAPRSGPVTDSGLPDSELPDSGAQFRQFEQVVDMIARFSGARPLLLVIDDLQWGDVASLRLFGHLAARLPGGSALAGAMRDSAPVPGSELSRVMAGLARVPGHRRIRLGPLGAPEVARLIRDETGNEVDATVARTVHVRTGGNPFFVREIARQLAGGGPLAGEGVPFSVRDVVLDRTAGLGDAVRDVLEIAAFLGRDVNLLLLATVAGIDVQTCLDRLEPLGRLGLLRPVSGDPFAFSFVHDLVRESITAAMPSRRATPLHLRVAEALERAGTRDDAAVERLAYHLWAAGPLADPARTADALTEAGRRAVAKLAFVAAEQHLRSAVQLARSAGLPERELPALSLLVAVFKRQAGYTGSYIELLDRAEYVAGAIGRTGEAADFLFTRVISAFSSVQPDHLDLARRLYAQGQASADPVVRQYGQQGWGLHQWSLGDVGAALRHLAEGNRTLMDDRLWVVGNPLRRELHIFGLMQHAVVATLHGDPETTQVLLDIVEAAAGQNRYEITLWAHFATMAAAMSGEPAAAQRAAARWLAADPGHFVGDVDVFLRVTWCWMRALTGDDPAGAAAEGEAAMRTMMEGRRYGIAFHFGLVVEMWLAAAEPERAGAALELADHYLEAHGHRYAEGLILLLRARVLLARGAPAEQVRAAAVTARDRSAQQEAYQFARRAKAFLAELGD